MKEKLIDFFADHCKANKVFKYRVYDQNILVWQSDRKVMALSFKFIEKIDSINPIMGITRNETVKFLQDGEGQNTGYLIFCKGKFED